MKRSRRWKRLPINGGKASASPMRRFSMTLRNGCRFKTILGTKPRRVDNYPTRTSRVLRDRRSSRLSRRRCNPSRIACSSGRDSIANNTSIESTQETSAYAFFNAERAQEDSSPPVHGGFALAHFSGNVELERKVKDKLSVTVRCIPLAKSEPGTCPFTGKPSAQRVVWAKAY
jgi:Prolyl-tRNA synthetase, C-terminal